MRSAVAHTERRKVVVTISVLTATTKKKCIQHLRENCSYENAVLPVVNHWLRLPRSHCRGKIGIDHATKLVLYGKSLRLEADRDVATVMALSTVLLLTLTHSYKSNPILRSSMHYTSLDELQVTDEMREQIRRVSRQMQATSISLALLWTDSRRININDSPDSE